MGANNAAKEASVRISKARRVDTRFASLAEEGNRIVLFDILIVYLESEIRGSTHAYNKSLTRYPVAVSNPVIVKTEINTG